MVLEALNWKKSQVYCAQLHTGAHLAVIANKMQDKAVINYLSTLFTGQYWIDSKKAFMRFYNPLEYALNACKISELDPIPIESK